MEYKVIPFVAKIDPRKGSSSDVAEQLKATIDLHTAEGWDYVRLESVTTFVAPDNGCFGLGAKPGFNTSRQMIVFQK